MGKKRRMYVCMHKPCIYEGMHYLKSLENESPSGCAISTNMILCGGGFMEGALTASTEVGASLSAAAPLEGS
jgi:hypothetical protein